MRQTRRCVRCLKRNAWLYGGFIARRGTNIMAGWCSVCWRAHKGDPVGWRGHYRWRMGLEPVRVSEAFGRWSKERGEADRKLWASLVGGG